MNTENNLSKEIDADPDTPVEDHEPLPAVEATVASIDPIDGDSGDDDSDEIIIVEDNPQALPYRAPQEVITEIQQALSALDSAVSEEDLVHANNLAYNEAVALEDVQWIAAFFAQYSGAASLHGGYKGQRWAEKILGNVSDGTDPNASLEITDDPAETDDSDDTDTGFSFQDSDLAFFAVGTDENSSNAYLLLGVDFDSFSVALWTDGTFETIDGVTPTDIDEPLVMPIDPDTAQALSAWLDSEDPDKAGQYDLLDSDPDERNLFLLADSEIDYEELGMYASIVADATGYAPAERGANAGRQVRDSAGKFHGEQVPQSLKLGSAYAKAHLDEELPLVDEHAAYISDWLTNKAVTAAAEASTPVQNVKEVAAPKDALKQVAPDEPTAHDHALYFAIVDDTDRTAVLNVVAITKDAEGNAQAWLRSNGEWVNSPETLADLQGATPPPVVELTAPSPLKGVLSQVDEHDAGADDATAETPLAASAASVNLEDAKRGYALPDGMYAVHTADELKSVVEAFPLIASAEQGAVKRHLKKRAEALNRKDLLPPDWRSNSLVEVGEGIASTSPLMGEYGEVLVAASTKGAKGGVSGVKGYERLKQYWTHGDGAAKIRWGTKGDLTRAHSHLSKYVGPAMAWGLAQNYHKSLFGMSNATHDKMTGQTESHHKG